MRRAGRQAECEFEKFRNGEGEREQGNTTRLWGFGGASPNVTTKQGSLFFCPCGFGGNSFCIFKEDICQVFPAGTRTLACSFLAHIVTSITGPFPKS